MINIILFSTSILKNFARKPYFAFLFSMLLISSAQGDSGLGVVIGDPTGLSGRLGLDDRHSFETAFAFSSGSYEGLYLHGTYLWDRARRFPLQQGSDLEMYYGLGLRVISINKGKYDGEIAIGPRAPIGLLYNFNNPNVEIFAEISATLDLSPRSDVDVDAGVGARVRF